MVGLGVHERYDLPALAFLLPALLLAPRWTVPVLLISLTITVNAAMGVPLDKLYPQGARMARSWGVRPERGHPGVGDVADVGAPSACGR